MSRNRTFSSLILLFVLVLLAAAFLSLGTQKSTVANAQPSLALTQHYPDIQYQNNTIYIALWVINIYSFNYQTGSYTFDFYAVFFWIDPNITTANWYIMNGYPTYPGAKMLVASSYTGEIKYEAYRVRASLTTPIQGTDYPFDKIKLDIAIEILTNGYPTSLVWLANDTGVSSGFENVGWTKPTFTLTNSTSYYPLGVVSPRVDMYIDEERNTYGAVVETIIPPLIFCVVAGICFLFQMHETNAFSLRVAVTTSMLITAVLFNIAQENNLPPLTGLTLYDIFIDSVILFLALSVIVNILGYVEWMRNQDKKRVNQINRWGFAFSVGVPALIFLILFILK